MIVAMIKRLAHRPGAVKSRSAPEPAGGHERAAPTTEETRPEVAVRESLEPKTLAHQGQRSARLKLAASNGGIWTTASPVTVAIVDHSPAASSNASRVRAAGSTSQR